MARGRGPLLAAPLKKRIELPKLRVNLSAPGALADDSLSQDAVREPETDRRGVAVGPFPGARDGAGGRPARRRAGRRTRPRHRAGDEGADRSRRRRKATGAGRIRGGVLSPALASAFPACACLQGDASDLPRTLAGWEGPPVRAIVSSLPLLNQPPARRTALIEDAFALMAKGRRFRAIQLRRGFADPPARRRGPFRRPREGSAPIWANLPPARVWTYRADPRAKAPAPLITRLCARADRLGEIGPARPKRPAVC